MAELSLEELLAQLDRDELLEKTQLEAGTSSAVAAGETAQSSELERSATSSGQPARSVKWASVEDTLAGLDHDEAEHTAREEQQAFRAIGDVQCEEDRRQGTRLKMLQDMKPGVDWEGILRPTPPAHVSKGDQPRTLPEGALSNELDMADEDAESNFERMCRLRVERHKKEKEAAQQKNAQLHEAPRTVPRGGFRAGPRGKMPNTIGLSAGSRLGSSSSSRAYPVPTFTANVSAQSKELPPRKNGHEVTSKAEPAAQEAGAGRERTVKESRGRRRLNPSNPSGTFNGLPSYDELLSSEDECEARIDPVSDIGEPIVCDDYLAEESSVVEMLLPEYAIPNYTEVDEDPDLPINQQPIIDSMEKFGLSTFSRLLVKDELATREAFEKKASTADQRAARADDDIDLVPVYDTDVRYQWIYTDTETTADANFVLDIFGASKNNTLEARFLDDGVPTSAKVTCSIQDTAIVIEEKTKYTKTTYRGTLSRNKKQISGRWTDRKSSNTFSLKRTLSVRDFCFHWRYADVGARSSFVLSIWEEGQSQEPKAQFSKNGSPTTSEVGCTIVRDYIRFEEVSANGWTRYEGTLAKNGKSISGHLTDRIGYSQKFKLERLLPSSSALPEDEDTFVSE